MMAVAERKEMAAEILAEGLVLLLAANDPSRVKLRQPLNLEGGPVTKVPKLRLVHASGPTETQP